MSLNKKYIPLNARADLEGVVRERTMRPQVCAQQCATCPTQCLSSTVNYRFPEPWTPEPQEFSYMVGAMSEFVSADIMSAEDAADAAFSIGYRVHAVADGYVIATPEDHAEVSAAGIRSIKEFSGSDFMARVKGTYAFVGLPNIFQDERHVAVPACHIKDRKSRDEKQEALYKK